jgi:myosin heavy subunit
MMSSLFPEGGVAQESSKLVATTANAFKVSLNELVQTLATKIPRYVRCIKTNTQLKGATFDADHIRHQASD